MLRTSLGVQCLGAHLPMWRPWLWSLVRKDPTYYGATKPKDPHSWTRAPEPVLCTKRAVPAPSTRESLRAATRTQHSHKFLKKEMSRSTSDISEGAKTSTCFYFITLKVNVLKKREKLNTAAVTGNEKRCTDLIRVLPRHSANFRC